MKLIKRYPRNKFENKERKLPKGCRFLTDVTYSAVNEYENKNGKTLLRIELLPKVARSLIENSIELERVNDQLSMYKAQVIRLKEEIKDVKADHTRMAESLIQFHKEIADRYPDFCRQNDKKSPYKDSLPRLEEAGTNVRSPAIQGGHPGHGKRSK